MTVTSNFLCRSLETAISVRKTLDFRAAQSIARLQDKLVQFESGDTIAHLRFHNGQAIVREGSVDSPDVIIKGPIQRVSQALVLDRMDLVRTEGDTEALQLLSEVFVPPLYSSDLEEKVVNAVDACASFAVRSLQPIFRADRNDTRK